MPTSSRADATGGLTSPQSISVPVPVPVRSSNARSKTPLTRSFCDPGPGRISATDTLLRFWLDLAGQAQAAEVDSARISAEDALIDAVNVSVEPPAPVHWPLNMDPAAIEVVQNFLLQHVNEPKMGIPIALKFWPSSCVVYLLTRCVRTRLVPIWLVYDVSDCSLSCSTCPCHSFSS